MNMVDLRQQLKNLSVLYSAFCGHIVSKMSNREVDGIIDAIMQHYAVTQGFYEEDARFVMERFCATGVLSFD